MTALLVFAIVTAGVTAQSQTVPRTGEQDVQAVLRTLKQGLDRVALARDRGERFDIRDLNPTPGNVTPLIGVSRQMLLDMLGAPTVDCRRVLPNAGRIAPCQAVDDLVYSFYALPTGWRGGGTELLLEFSGGRCTRARWISTQ